MATNPFIERYSKLTNAELLEIIRRADDYQPLAVQTAQGELGRRNLTDEQLADAKSINEQKHQKETKHQEKVKAVEDKLKSISSSVYDAINPVRTKELTIDKWIKGICLLMGVSFLYMIIKDFALIKFIFTDNASQWDFTTVLFILLYLFIPVTTILFWYRKKLGWILIAGYLSLSGCLSLYFSITGIFIKQSSNFFQPSTVINFGETIFFLGGVVFLCRLATRDIYGITKNIMLVSVGVPTVITTLICSQLFVTAFSTSDKETTRFEIHSSTSALEKTPLPMPGGSAMPNIGSTLANTMDSTTEKFIKYTIFSIEEVKQKNIFIDSLSNHKMGIALIIEKPTNEEKDYYVKAGYNGKLRFETYFNFYFNPVSKKITIDDVVSGERLTLKAWRKKTNNIVDTEK